MKLLSSAVLVAAMSAPLLSPAHAAEPTLFDELGGKPGIIRIVDDLIAQVQVDPRTRERFEGMDMPHIALRLKEQICVVSDGPCHYRGKSMKMIHDGLNINDAQFNALVEDLQDAMDRAGVAYAAQNRLLARLAPLHKDVVTQ